MGQKKTRLRTNLVHVPFNEYIEATLNWYNLKQAWICPKKCVFEEVLVYNRNYAYPANSMFLPRLAKIVRMAASPHYETLIKAYFVRRYHRGKASYRDMWK